MFENGRHLKDLVLGGFIARDVTFDPRSGADSRKERYRLRDNYVRFYLRYVEPRRTRIEKGLMDDMALEHLPGWDAVAGLQFENLVLNNVPAVAGLLRLGRTQILAAAPFVQKPTKRKKGCQVDLLLLTRHSLYVVEIKRRRRVGRQVIEEVAEKVRRLPRYGERSIRTALVYHGELDPRVEEEGYFDVIIPFDRLLSPPL